MWILELFGDTVVLAVDAALTRRRAWRAYRRFYGAAERREHSRQLSAHPARDAPPRARTL